MKPYNKVSVATLATAVVIFNFSSCKYEDGPKFTLKSKKGRLVGQWDAKFWAGEAVQEGSVINLDFEDDNDIIIHYEYSYSYNGTTYEYEYDYLGTWEWTDKKEGLRLTVDNSDPYEVTILKLTSDELSFKDKDGDKYELTAID